MNQYDNDLSKIEDLLHSDNPESIQVAMTLLESIQISNQKVYIEYVEKMNKSYPCWKRCLNEFYP